MSNLALYDKFRSVPENAQKKITGGRLNGKTDINPMWRIKTLTEHFGPCGIGWKYTITKQWLEQGANGEIGAFVNIDLYIKHEGQWSEAIPGTGGSMFVTNEKSGPYTSDECFKMALTDAISVACKALGIGADIYWGADSTKYTYTATERATSENTPSGFIDVTGEPNSFEPEKQPQSLMATEAQLKKIYATAKQLKLGAETMTAIIKERYKKENSKELTKKEASDLISYLGAESNAN